MEGGGVALSLRTRCHALVFTVDVLQWLCQKLCVPPDDIMNLQRLCQVLKRLWFFHFHINLKYRLNSDSEEKGIVARPIPRKPQPIRSLETAASPIA